MCKRCDEIDTKIENYRWLRNGVKDQSMVDQLSASIAEVESEKSKLHTTPPSRPPTRVANGHAALGAAIANIPGERITLRNRILVIRRDDPANI
jgi:hypothetical protein